MDGKDKGFLPLNIDGRFGSDFIHWGAYEEFIREKIRISGVFSLLNKESAVIARRDIVEFLKSIGVILDPGAAAAKVWQKWYDDSYCAVPTAADPAEESKAEEGAAAGSRF